VTVAHPWVASIVVRRPTANSAGHLLAVLSPEAGREVPRSTASISQRGDTVTLRVRARDTGALRAAVNTFLGWVDLATRTEQLGAPEALPVAVRL
jgi:tRNA threonylcarbamoyladenosine modification (KEOPS) complex  Pcc1 subunit